MRRYGSERRAELLSFTVVGCVLACFGGVGFDADEFPRGRGWGGRGVGGGGDWVWATTDGRREEDMN